MTAPHHSGSNTGMPAATGTGRRQTLLAMAGLVVLAATVVLAQQRSGTTRTSTSTGGPSTVAALAALAL